MLADFHFIRPYFLLALLAVFLFILLLMKNKLSRGDWTKVCDADLLPFILQDNPVVSTHRWSLIVFSIASILSILALAGPTWERLPTPVFRNHAAVVIALDLSQSMDASDIKPSRLIRARYKIEDLLAQRQDGLTALLVYAGDAFTVTPLTSDTKTISSQLNALTTDIMPIQGSNTVTAVKLAKSLLQQAGEQQGDIILITDDVSTNDAKRLPALLKNDHLSLLGVGTQDGAPVKLANGGFLKDTQGNIVVPKLNIHQLASLAKATHGRYQTITSDDHDIQTLMHGLSRPTMKNNTLAKNHLIDVWDDKGPWLLLLVLPFAALFFRKGLLVLPFILLLHFPQESQASIWQDLWQTTDQQAQQEFKQQHYKQAAQQFHSPEWKAAAQYKAGDYQQTLNSLKAMKTADSYYNQGNALAKMGKLKEALTAYQHALDLQPKHKDALYNKKLVEQALKQQNKKNKNKNKSQQSNKNKLKNDDKSPSKAQQQDPSQQKNKSNSDNRSQQSKSHKNDSDNKQQNKTEKSDKLTQKEQEKLKEETQKEAAKKQAKSDTKKPSQPPKEHTNINAQSEQEQQKKAAQTQWLKRIPDDPSGLLKRKFKYQYNQRNSNQRQQDQAW